MRKVKKHLRSGFILELAEGVEFEPLIARLSQLRTLFDMNPNCFNFVNHQLELLRVSKDLIPCLKTWMTLQATNPKMSKYRALLIEEMARFISTGKHETQLTQIESLIAFDENQFAPKTPMPCKDIPLFQKGYYEWVRQPSGFEDLMHFLTIVFKEEIDK